MNPTDSTTLKKALDEAAEATGGKAPGEAGMRAWFRILKDHPIERCVDALDEWIRTKAKMPTPADILTVLAHRAERQATMQRIVEHTLPRADVNSPLYRAFRTSRGARAQAARDGLAWARALRERELAGEPLTTVQRENWRRALGVAPHEMGIPDQAPAGDRDTAAREAAEERAGMRIG